MLFQKIIKTAIILRLLINVTLASNIVHEQWMKFKFSYVIAFSYHFTVYKKIFGEMGEEWTGGRSGPLLFDQFLRTESLNIYREKTFT